MKAARIVKAIGRRSAQASARWRDTMGSVAIVAALAGPGR